VLIRSLGCFAAANIRLIEELVSLTENRHLLYTRGSVWFFETYPGSYIPEPIEMRIVRSEESPTFLATEILA